MRVRAKVTLLLALLFAVLIGAQWAIQQRLVLPRFMELERASARTDMQRVELAVERELQSLGAAASDWGNWADTWRYMRRHDPRYAQANLTDTAVRTLKVDYLALIASDGHFEWARSIDPVSGQRGDIRLNHTGQLEPAWARALASGEPVSGLDRHECGRTARGGRTDTRWLQPRAGARHGDRGTAVQPGLSSSASATRRRLPCTCVRRRTRLQHWRRSAPVARRPTSGSPRPATRSTWSACWPVFRAGRC